MTTTLITNGLPWLASGLVLGAVYFFLLARSAAAIGDAGNWRSAARFLVLRVALAVAVFAMAAMQGAPALLFALTGFLVARAIAISRVRRAG